MVDLEVPADELGLAPSRGQLRMRVLPEGLDGEDVSDIWLRAEPRREQAEDSRQEMRAALGEVSGVLPA